MRREVGNLRAALLNRMDPESGAFVRDAFMAWVAKTWPETPLRTKRSKVDMSPEERERRFWSTVGAGMSIGPSAARKTALATGLGARALAKYAHQLANRINMKQGAAMLGVSVKTFRSLADDGVIPYSTDLINDGRCDRTFLASEVGGLARRLVAIARPFAKAPAKGQWRPLSEAFRLQCNADWPGKKLLASIEAGEVPIWLDDEADAMEFARLRVDLADVRRAILSWLETSNPGWITVFTAGKLLGIGPDAVLWRASKGHMPSMVVKVGPRAYRLVRV